MSKFHKQMNRELRKQSKQYRKDWKKDPLKETCKTIAANAAVDAVVIAGAGLIINHAVNKKIEKATSVGTPAPASTKKSILPWKNKKNKNADPQPNTPPANNNTQNEGQNNGQQTSES